MSAILFSRISVPSRPAISSPFCLRSLTTPVPMVPKPISPMDINFFMALLPDGSLDKGADYNSVPLQPKRLRSYIKLSCFVKRIHSSPGLGPLQPATPPVSQYIQKPLVIRAFQPRIILNQGEGISPGIAEGTVVANDVGDTKIG